MLGIMIMTVTRTQFMDRHRVTAVTQSRASARSRAGGAPGQAVQLERVGVSDSGGLGCRYHQ